ETAGADDHRELYRSLLERSIGYAYGRYQAEAALRNNQARLNLLNGLAMRIAAGAPVEMIIEQALAGIREQFPDLRAAYSTISPEGLLTVSHSAQPPEMPSLAGVQVDLNAAPDYYAALLCGEPVVIPDAQREPRVAPLADTMRSLACQAVVET